MKQAYLDYFKSLFEGTAEISWNAWFRVHEEELKAKMKRAEFLRLKFQNLEEAEKYLQEAKVSYHKDPLAYKRESYYALLGSEVLDEKGRPLESFQRQAYDGAKGKLMDGDVEGGRELLKKFIQKVCRYPQERRQEELEGLCFDGEMELDLGNPQIGRAYLEAVASVPVGNALTDFAVEQAKSLLQQLND